MDEKITRKDLWRMLNNTDSGLMAYEYIVSMILSGEPVEDFHM